MKNHNRQFGSEQEQQANEFLQQQGLRLLGKNFSCKLGEIDLIMLDEDTYVFVEVRFRKASSYGGGLESITVNKQNKIRKTAQYFLLQNKLIDVPCRFDAVAITNQQGMTRFNWIKDAFW